MRPATDAKIKPSTAMFPGIRSPRRTGHKGRGQEARGSAARAPDQRSQATIYETEARRCRQDAGHPIETAIGNSALYHDHQTFASKARAAALLLPHTGPVRKRSEK